ncbi:MAG TPA: hypothetical protein VHV83_07330 [Armatimonadota bacterium]|nr:hypothetical protein [Armatimonadota bacterium]
MSLLRTGAIIACLSVAGMVFAQARTIRSFETQDDLNGARFNSTKATIVTDHATDGKQALQVVFKPGTWPSIVFATATPWNWQGTGILAFDVTNPSAQDIDFGVRIDDDPASDGATHCRTGAGKIEAGKTATFTAGFVLQGAPPQGMRDVNTNGQAKFAADHVYAYQIFMHNIDNEKTLILDNFRLLQATPMPKVGVGAFMNVEWPAKVQAITNNMGVLARGTKLSLTTDQVPAGKQALKADFQPIEWPNVGFKNQYPWDWSGFGSLALDVTNPTDQPVEFSVRIDDDPTSDGGVHCRVTVMKLEAQTTATFAVVFAGKAPQMPNMRVLTGYGKGDFNPATIFEYQIYMHKPAAATTLLIRNFRLLPIQN